MTPSGVSGLDEIDWSRPWLAPWRDRGEALVARVAERGLVDALNDAVSGTGVRLRAGRLRFVAHRELPAGEAYEEFIARTACVPTRENLHDFFNALVWLGQPALKRRLNELQAGQLAITRPGAARGAVRDALTLFDENAALLEAPGVLIEALRTRDWHTLFVSQRVAWGQAHLLVFGHALMEKLMRPRKAITAHVWCVPLRPGSCNEAGDAFDTSLARWLTDSLADSLTAEPPRGKPFMPLPMLGVPGWWAANEAPGFYADDAVFRPAKRNSGPQAAVGVGVERTVRR